MSSLAEKYPYGDKDFYSLLEEIAKLHNDKNRQYASKENPLGAFERNAVIQGKLYKDSIKNKELACAMSFMGKQIDGAYEIVGCSKENTPDSLEEKLKDVAIYSLLAILLARKGNKINKKD
jgi:hypothetical protein